MAEITKDDLFGWSIIKIITDFKIKSFLEIGAWDGTGSTSCIIDAMLPMSEKSLTCLEIDKDKFSALVNNTKQFDWIKCCNESSISYNSLIHKNFDEIWNSPYNGLPRQWNPKAVVNGWFDRDVELIKQYEFGFLEKDNSFYEGVLIDGGEFLGYSEFVLLKNRTNFLFLDDVFHSIKNKQVAFELSKDNDWECLCYNENVRNGFVVFKRKDI